jgi:sugar lactone lactonase YvrE
METKTTVLVDSLRFPEGPRWHAGQLWVCDYYARRVVQVDLQGLVQPVVSLPDLPAALGWTPDEQLLIVSGRNRRLLRLAGSELVEVADLSTFSVYPCADMVIDRQGRAYIGNVGFDFGMPQAQFQPGPILLVTPDRRVRVAADGLAFPNGMAITPDGQTLIVAESYASRLTGYHVEVDGSLTGRRVWAQFDAGSEPRVTPDGISLDAEGAVWAASPGSREVLRVREGGQVTQRLSLEAIPLACMLGGPERQTLFITTTESLDFNDRQARGRVETLPVDVPGAGWPAA